MPCSPITPLCSASSLPAGRAGTDPVDAQFRLVQSLRLGRVQEAYGAAAARAAAREPALVALVREEQDVGQLVAVLLDVLNDVAMAPASQVDPAVVARLRAQLRELRKAQRALRAEIGQRFPSYRELMRPAALSLADAQRKLAPNEALLVFHVAPDPTDVWAVPGNGAPAYAAVNLGRRALSRKVQRLRDALDPGAVSTLGEIPAFDLGVAHELYRLLLEPVSGAWSGRPQLLVVADGPLGQLPLSLPVSANEARGAGSSLLFGGFRNVDWLAREHTVTVLPAVASLTTFARIERPPASSPFVGFGDPVFTVAGAPPRRGAPGKRSVVLRSSPQTRSADSAGLALLPALPETADELRAIAAALGASVERDVFLGSRATEEQVKRMDLERYRVLAFATHGLLPGDIDGLAQPGLALSSPAITVSGGDGLLTVDEILELRLAADWAVLSACNTGAADGRGAEAVSGLGRAFFYAGANALLVSNWPVHSGATRDLVAELFRIQSAAPGIARAEALRRASLAMADDGVRRDACGDALFSYAHPIFWAPFTVVGNGR
jgi:CHAT domain-containing protein